MIQTVAGNAELCRGFIEKLKERIGENDRKVDGAVAEILENVRKNGDAAVRAYTEKFDGAAPEKTEISREELKALAAQCDPKFLSALEKAAANIRDFHQRQKQQSWLTTQQDGVLMGQRVRGLHRVGIYVPGGTAAYPSSVLMNAIPAKIAEVGEIIMVTPPAKGGKPNPDIMAAAPGSRGGPGVPHGRRPGGSGLSLRYGDGSQGG